jgi:hypothetical protein
MYCPTCRTEYREGFSTCADCGAALVTTLPSPGTEIEPGLEPMLRTSNSDEMSLLIEALEAAEIPYVLQAGTALALLDGERLFASRPGAWEARIWVASDRLDEAKEVVGNVRLGPAR